MIAPEKQDFTLPILNFPRNGAWVELHNRAIVCARNLKSAYRELLNVLIEVEEKKIYVQLEQTSLFKYCVDILLLPKHTAYDFIDVVRTSKDIPELAQAVIDGRALVSNARRVCSVITPQNQAMWIDLICQEPQSVIQRCVAAANPKAASAEKLSYISGTTLKIEFAVSEEWAQLLKDTKDLLSSRKKRAVSTEEALFILMAENKKRNDPVLKAERALKRKRRVESDSTPSNLTNGNETSWRQPNSSDSSPSTETTTLSTTTLSTTTLSTTDLADDDKQPHDLADQLGTSPRSRYIEATVEHEVTLRDQNQCAYIDSRGVRCSEKRWLQKHHIVEFAKGGTHSADNLETLCTGHHRMRHQLH